MKKLKLNEKDEKELRNFLKHLTIASMIRTFPNNRNLSFDVAKTLNVIGHDIDELIVEISIILGDIEPFPKDYHPDSRIRSIPLCLKKKR